jgi:ankyrin repeat protein
MLGFVLGFGPVAPNALLHAASNAAPVAEAAKADDLAAVRKLIKEHADVNAGANDGSSALLWAAYRSNAEMTKTLLAAGATVDKANNYGVTPLLQGQPQRRRRGHRARCSMRERSRRVGTLRARRR